MSARWIARACALFGSSALVVAFAPVAAATGPPGGDTGGSQSTPGVVVTAQNPGTSPGRDLRLTLTAHSEPGSVPNPDCRPPEPTLRCFGSLVLRVPADSAQAAGLAVTGFQEVHKVSVGETSCGDDHGGDCDGDETDGGSGCEEGGGCAVAATANNPAGAEAVVAHVNGIAVVAAPGATGLQVGEPVQVQITLYDNGTARYQDQVLVQVRPRVDRMQNSVPWTYQSQEQVIQQVRIHYLGNTGL